MIEPGARSSDESSEISAFEIAGYIFDVSQELALMAGERGLSKLAAALEMARALAAEAVAEHASQSLPEKAAPEDAA